ncbi:MAG TPA: YdiU family protein [Amaricoccus sp.]|uniref:protein adenylyltransferase SelO n=1 Tax=Amaricoccus sp. TaxID=1872485 RepID=UPI002BDC2F79|nr:YdiU family protein [Amaricoccus sp.]HMQ93792.1 YdiU family protein [Amaricoccus sp.]HMR53526.1 YdiU family protein [Amaricoccus sp.]HMR60818.1 YdiU family protein [Amaricoccus sp.]HMU00614.1 YdiU family protein [Amaricoccus sp.]
MATPRHRPETTHEALGPEFLDPVRPARFPKSRLRFRNDRWAARIGLDKFSDAEWIGHFARFEPLPGSFAEPLALRYHGHQFRAYNPDIGDGRGFLFAQLRDLADGRLLDLGTKGSGTTPYSRQGDGRLTLKGGVREILATEMLEALGVYTSKTLSLVETGEALIRGDEPSPTRSSVMVRLSHSHIRIGSFQRLAAHGLLDEIRRLTEHCIAHFWPLAAEAEDPAAGLYDAITGAVARMGAEWFAAGFVHGVLNTDNVNITGESFDYGPWRFLDRFDPAFTAAYFDQTGLYCFARQPEALNWNLARLGECLIPVSSVEAITPVFESFAERFQAELARQTFARLGLLPGDPAEARSLMHRFWGAMQTSAPPFQQVFHDLLGGGLPERLHASPIRATFETAAWAEVIEGLRDLPKAPGLDAALAHPYARRPEPVTMVIDEVEAIWSAIDTDDDWRPLALKLEELREAGEFNCRLGLLAGPNGRPGHVPL